MNEYTLHHSDCLDVLPTLAENSIDAIVTDPPYFKIKDDEWDRQWKKPAHFIAWLDNVLAQVQRVLRPNGSLYLFASSKMAARVEMLVSERFNVLNHIVWIKTDREWHLTSHRGNRTRKADLRAWWPETERIIFAEHYGADNMAKGEGSDELRSFVFEPLRAYLDSERARAGVTPRQIMDYFESNGWPKYVTARHSFTQSQWELPTVENYERLRRCFHDLNHGGEYLRRDYEDLRRPFSVSEKGIFSDVWMFAPVSAYEAKHTCEKPQTLLTHMIAASTRPGALILDPFMGTGSTGLACLGLGRRFIGIELSGEYVMTASGRLAAAASQLRLELT